MTERKRNNYVNNEELYNHMVARRKMIKEALDAGKEKPSLQNDNYLGNVIYAICHNLSYKTNFIGYSFTDEMVSDAVENLVRVADNFDPAKSKYPFAYFTQIAWQAFVRRIQLEAKQQKIKGAMIQEMLVDDLFDSQEIDDDGISYKTHFIDYLKENSFIAYDSDNKPKKSIDDVKVGLEVFYAEEDDLTYNEDAVMP